MLLRWEGNGRVGNDRIDQEPPFLFQGHNEFDHALAEQGKRSPMLQLSSRLADPLGADPQNKKNDGAKSAQPA